MPRRTSLFVYGTLQRSRQMEAVLRGVSDWRYAGAATVAGELYDAGEYPALVLKPRATSRIRGRIVEIDDAASALALLDDYEGVSEGLYVRRRRGVHALDGTRRLCWLYEYARAVDRLPRIPCWPPHAHRAPHAAR